MTIKFTQIIVKAERIFIMGNGGSLATANHLALDWSKSSGKMVISLTGSESITANGNDNGFENIFVNQLACFGITKQDVIVLISASGNSPNIVKVLKQYPVNKFQVLGMTGNKGYLKSNTNVQLSVSSDDVQIIEDAHLCYGHVITNVLNALRKKSKPSF